MDGNQDEPKSLLANLRNHHVVEVHNPLSEDFTWTVGRSVVEADPKFMDQTINKLNLRNSDHPTMDHVRQPITIASGKSMKLPGDVAQVIVKHLVDEIMNREGNKANIGDPTLRRAIEEQVIINTEDLISRLSTLSIEEQLDKQIKDLNREETREVAPNETETAFPGLGRSNEGNEGSNITSGAANDPGSKSSGQKEAPRRGRPPARQSVPSQTTAA